MAVYITLDEAKRHLHVDYDDDDAYIMGLTDMAEEVVLTDIQGVFTGEGTVSTSVSVNVVGAGSNFLKFKVGDTIRMIDSTLGTITDRVIATITSNTALTVTAAFALVTSGLTYEIYTGVSTPLLYKLKQAMLLLIGHFYQNREATTFTNITEMPLGYKYLIASEKNWTVG
jgi:hypothetical protein